MPLWRDPLDELIADLERALPPQQAPPILDMPSFTDVQFAVWAVLGRAAERERQARDPRVQAVYAYYEGLAARLKAGADTARDR